MTESDLLHIARNAFASDKPARIAVAVSGGSDSLAALQLMATADGSAVHAVTVDHALRAASATEAAMVADHCARLGVSHETLIWQHGAIAGNLMDAARRARYALMADWAAARNISHIVLGHTADDQAETFLMGLARGAGIDGLAGMRPSWRQGAVNFVRPFLTCRRADLRAYLLRQAVAWIDDPGNEDEGFTRIKARRALKELQPLGFTVEVLTGVVANLRSARQALRIATIEAARICCREDSGTVVFDREAWGCSGAEVQRRLLNLALLWISGAGYPPRGSSLNRVLRAIDNGTDTTLAGCRIRMSEGSFRVMREPRAVAGLACPPGQLWDGRWQVDGPVQNGMELRALGAAGLRLCRDWRATGIPRDALVVSPAVWYDESLIAAPLAGFGPEWRGRIVADFSQFVVSH